VTGDVPYPRAVSRSPADRPPMPYPPPVYATGPGFAAPPRKRRRWVFPLIGAGLLLVGFCLFASVRFFLTITTAADRIGAVETAASDYLTDIEQGRFAEAYARTCASDREGMTLDAFTAGVRADEPFISFEITDSDIQYARKPSSAVAFAEVAYEDGSVATENVPLVETEDGWQVCRTG
jgi:hypothetical protein